MERCNLLLAIVMIIISGKLFLSFLWQFCSLTLNGRDFVRRSKLLLSKFLGCTLLLGMVYCNLLIYGHILFS